MIKLIMHDIEDIMQHMRLHTLLLIVVLALIMFMMGFTVMNQLTEKNRINNAVSTALDYKTIEFE